eukprot:jgi/Botrbrau1/8175/Bobra.357_2s0020.1
MQCHRYPCCPAGFKIQLLFGTENPNLNLLVISHRYHVTCRQHRTSQASLQGRLQGSLVFMYICMYIADARDTPFMSQPEYSLMLVNSRARSCNCFKNPATIVASHRLLYNIRISQWRRCTALHFTANIKQPLDVKFTTRLEGISV